MVALCKIGTSQTGARLGDLGVNNLSPTRMYYSERQGPSCPFFFFLAVVSYPQVVLIINC